MFIKPIYREKYTKLYNINKSLNQNKINTYENKINNYENKINNYEDNINTYEDKINTYENKKNILPPPYEEFDYSILYNLSPQKLKQLVNNNLIYFTLEEYNNYIDTFIELRYNFLNI